MTVRSTPLPPPADQRAAQTVALAVCVVGKHAAGRLLDGREWDEVPEPALTVASGS